MSDKDDIELLLPLMWDTIAESEEAGREAEFVACKRKDGSIYTTWPCFGDVCTVKMSKCDSNEENFISFHTHPYEAIKGAAGSMKVMYKRRGYPEHSTEAGTVPSLEDVMVPIVLGFRYTCIGNVKGISCYKNKTRDELSSEAASIMNDFIHRNALITISSARDFPKETRDKIIGDYNFWRAQIGAPWMRDFFDEVIEYPAEKE